MESIVVSLLGKYFRLFIKDFQKEQLSIQAMAGKVDLRDVELVNTTMQEMLLIPTSLLVTKATCNAINLQLPKVTEISKRPLALSIDRVDLTLEEPEVVPPMPTALREMLAAKKKDPSKQQKDRDAIGRSMNYSVNSLNFSMKLRNHPHVLSLQVRDFRLLTCTAARNPTEDLVGARVVNAADNSETIFKTGSIGSVTLSIGEGADRIVIFDGLPGKLNMSNAVTCDVGLPLKTIVEVIIGKFGIVLDRGSFLRHYQFFKDLNACLDRVMPLSTTAATGALATAADAESAEKAAALKAIREKSGGESVEFDMQFEDWSVVVVDDKGTGDSFGVRGERFRLSAFPPRGVKQADGTVELCSGVNVAFGAVTLQHFPKGGAQGKVLIASKKDAVEDAEALDMVGFNASNRRVPDAPPHFGMKFWLNRLVILLDRELWGRVYSLFNLAHDHAELKVDLSALPEKAKQLKEKRRAKMQFSFEELYQAAEVSVDLHDVEIVVPEDASLEDDQLRTISSRYGYKKLQLRNTPGWSAVPHIADGKALLAANAVTTLPSGPSANAAVAGGGGGGGSAAGTAPARPPMPGSAPVLLPTLPPVVATPPPVPRRHAPKPPGASGASMPDVHAAAAAAAAAGGSPAPDTGSKWQVFIEGFSASLLQNGQVLHHVIEPANFELFGRVLSTSPPHLELAVRTSRQKIVLTAQVMDYFTALWHSHVKWARALLQLGESKEDSKVSLKDKLKQVHEGMEEMEDSVVKRLVDSAAREDYEGALTQSLMAFTALVYVRFDGGHAQFPLQKNPATGQFTQAEFESLETAIEINSKGQFVVVQLGSVAATNLQHDRVAIVFDLVPVRRKASSIPAGKSSNLSSVMVALSRPGIALGAPTIIEVGLSNMSITSKGKKALAPMEMMGELTKYAESAGADVADVMAIAKSDTLREKGQKVLAGLNPYWRFKLGECIFTHKDHDAAPESMLHRGVASVGMVDWAALEAGFAELESQVIQSKMQLASNESEKEELRGNVRVLQATVEELMRQVESKSTDFVVVNNKLMEERMKMSDQMEEIQRLRAQLAQFTKGKK